MFPKNHPTIPIVISSYFKLNPYKEEKRLLICYIMLILGMK